MKNTAWVHSIHNQSSDERLQTIFEGLLLLCGILNKVICCLKSSNVTGDFAARAHSDPEMRSADAGKDTESGFVEKESMVESLKG